jgi:prefoldin subunit 5
MTAEQELASLKQQAEYFQNALDEISKRIEELEKAEQKK